MTNMVNCSFEVCLLWAGLLPHMEVLRSDRSKCDGFESHAVGESEGFVSALCVHVQAESRERPPWQEALESLSSGSFKN